MEGRFTPAPWKCKPISDRVLNHNRGFMISGYETEKSVRDVLVSEVTANAKLIAAAPELLEALQMAVTELEQFIPVTDVTVLDMCREAINKAIGGQDA